jgi:hypothetical protein
MEILLLRHQLRVLERQVARPQLTQADHALLAGFSQVLPRQVLRKSGLWLRRLRGEPPRRLRPLARSRHGAAECSYERRRTDEIGDADGRVADAAVAYRASFPITRERSVCRDVLRAGERPRRRGGNFVAERVGERGRSRARHRCGNGRAAKRVHFVVGTWLANSLADEASHDLQPVTQSAPTLPEPLSVDIHQRERRRPAREYRNGEDVAD